MRRRADPSTHFRGAVRLLCRVPRRVRTRSGGLLRVLRVRVPGLSRGLRATREERACRAAERQHSVADGPAARLGPLLHRVSGPLSGLAGTNDARAAIEEACRQQRDQCRFPHSIRLARVCRSYTPALAGSHPIRRYSAARICAMSARLSFLDAARGLAVIAMLLANLVNVFAPERPRWLAHNLGDELQLFDLPAPVFQFLIGTSLMLFLARHAKAGAPDAVTRLAIRRFVLLIGLGGVLDALAAGHLEVRWGVLQTLGMGGLVAVVFAGTSDVVALGVAALILATHY